MKGVQHIVVMQPESICVQKDMEAQVRTYDKAEVDLEEVLRFREKKDSVQVHMLEECSVGVVVSLGMNIPGPVKCTPLIEAAFYEGIRELEKVMEKSGKEILRKVILKEQAGCAAVCLVKEADGIQMKQEMILLEKSHALGRIWDIDVIGKEGMISRESVGVQSRKCLICGLNAKVCGRNRSHGIRELQARTAEIILKWKMGQENQAKGEHIS